LKTARPGDWSAPLPMQDSLCSALHIRCKLQKTFQALGPHYRASVDATLGALMGTIHSGCNMGN
jgi:hypothetical protein